MTKFKSMMTGTLAFLMVGSGLLSSAFASSSEPFSSGEPSAMTSGEMSASASAEPSGEWGAEALASADIATLGELVFDVAGVSGSAAEDVASLLENADTAALASELRALLDITQTMTDEALRSQIITLATAYGYSFTDAELDAIISAIRAFEPMSVDELQAKLEQLRGGVLAVDEIRESVSALGDRVQEFIQKLMALLERIFAGEGKSALAS